MDMRNRHPGECAFAASAALVVWCALGCALATPLDAGEPGRPAEDADAGSQYRQLHLSRDPSSVPDGLYRLDSHHTSVLAKLAHMDLARYTLRFDDVQGTFRFSASRSAASDLDISIRASSVDTGDAAFDARIASRYLGAEACPVIRYTAASAAIADGRSIVEGTLDFHGVRKPVTLNVEYRGTAKSRMGFSGVATFRRSDFGVGQWVPLEGDEVAIVIETEFVRQ
jgi:polyisoprenoid-binding protein YceI